MQTHHDQKSPTLLPASRSLEEGATMGKAVIQDERLSTQVALQLSAASDAALQNSPAAQLQDMATNKTGLPDGLKGGLENLSGMSMDDVRVHYNSSAPAQLNAHAYAQGTDIHLAAGQEKHLPHEAWHVVQQKQGRVRPTTAVGGQPVNDNQGLEAEADRMGGKAAQRMAISSAIQLKTGSARPVVQRKLKDISDLPAQKPFTEDSWASVKTGIATYKAIPLTDKRYATQRQLLAKLKLYAQKQQYKDEFSLRDEIEATRLKKEAARERMYDLVPGLSAKEAEVEKLAKNKEVSLSKPTGYDERHEKHLQSLVDKALLEKVNLEESHTREKDEFTRLSQEQARLVGLRQGVVDFKPQVIDGEIVPELEHVNDQMTGDATAKSAAFEKVEEGTGATRRFRKPSGINKLAKKISDETEDINKIKLLDKLQDLITAWRAENVDAASYAIKAEITGASRDQAEAVLEGIKLIEQQMLYTRNAVFKAIFSAPVAAPAAAAPKTNGEVGFGITDALLSGVKAESKAVQTGMKLDGPPTVFGVKETGGSVVGGDLLPKTEVGVGTTSIAASGSDLIARLIKFKDIKDDWAKAKGKMGKASFFADKVDAVTNVVNDGVSIAETGVNFAEEGRSKVSGFNSKDTFGKVSEMMGDITAGIMALKNAFLTVKYFYEAYQRKDTDGQQSFTSGAKGAMAFVQAAEGAMKLAAGVLKSFYNIAPEPLLRTIPIIGIALEVASGLLSVYTAVKANQAKKTVAGHLDPYKNAATGKVDAAGFHTKLSIDAAAIASISAEEERGVVGGKEKYLRFNAYVMAKIDDHVNGPNKGNDLVIIVNGAANVILTPADVATIREYEYISKMTEINQKRKTSSVQTVIKSVVGLAGKITTAAGVTAMIGTAIGGAVSASSLTYAVAKGGQKIGRNRRRAALNAQLPVPAQGIAGFPSQGDYLAARGPKTDRSAQQKETEYARHAFYIMDRLSTLPDPPPVTAPQAEIAAAEKRGAAMSEMLRSTGVDMFLFLNAATSADRVKLLISAQKSGR